MIRALGYSLTEFDAAKPGRLCRRRERWIEPWELDEPAPMHRLILSGACFTDDSARDALRGLGHAGISVAHLVTALFPRKPLLAFMEDGHPADVAEGAEGVEMYVGHRAGGSVQEPLMRWHRTVQGVREINLVLGDTQGEPRVRGFAVLNDEVDLDDLLDTLFLLTGMSSLDSPPARYQPSALPDTLKRVKAVVLLHRDKHGTALGVYSREPVRIEGRLKAICEKAECLLVPFAIPPMLARWDRALGELRVEWLATRDDEFPVPPAPEPSVWDPRRRRRGRRDAPPAVVPDEE